MLKIVRSMNERTVFQGKSTLLPTVVKDIEGTKTNLSFWQNHVDLGILKEGRVYAISNLVTEKYPNTKPYYLATRLGTKVELVSSEVEKQFETILYVDGTFTGEIVGFQDVHNYKVALNFIYF